ncbi:hypothetical protein RB195_020830 [Necator americanus]|uniref:Uncharacterized protein n=1 Tax=Necator americanus TaxID=51031 RepID=A0ABR1CM56_NECAM
MVETAFSAPKQQSQLIRAKRQWGRPPYGGGFRPPYGGGFWPPYGGGFRPPYGGGFRPPYGGGFRPPYGGGFRPPIDIGQGANRIRSQFHKIKNSYNLISMLDL